MPKVSMSLEILTETNRRPTPKLTSVQFTTILGVKRDRIQQLSPPSFQVQQHCFNALETLHTSATCDVQKYNRIHQSSHHQCQL